MTRASQQSQLSLLSPYLLDGMADVFFALEVEIKTICEVCCCEYFSFQDWAQRMAHPFGRGAPWRQIQFTTDTRHDGASLTVTAFRQRFRLSEV